jgi:tRNA (guanosine-2'-O-)-methyltransferase
VKNTDLPDDSWDVLSEILTENRRHRLTTAVKKRTEHIRLVLQDVHNPHNISACLRSAEAFGVQNVDIVTLEESFRPSTSSKGVSDWLSLHKWKSIDECAVFLKNSGYVIAAGMPAPDSIPLDQISLDAPVAILFGNENQGVSKDWQRHVDQYFTIPMHGLVESMNISVCAAITMHHLVYKLNLSKHPHQFINEIKQRKLLGKWARVTLKEPDRTYQELKQRQSKP